jgi:hypothetical protein
MMSVLALASQDRTDRRIFERSRGNISFATLASPFCPIANGTAQRFSANTKWCFPMTQDEGACQESPPEGQR